MNPSSENENFSWRLGEIMVQNGWITWEQLERAVKIQEQSKKNFWNVLSENKLTSASKSQMLHLGEILLKNKWIDWERLKKGLEIQKKTGKLIGEVLIENQLTKAEYVYRAVAIQEDKPFIDLSLLQVSDAVISQVPHALVLKLQCFPVSFENHVLLIAISDPKDTRPEFEFEKIFGNCVVKCGIAPPLEISRSIEKYYGTKP